MSTKLKELLSPIDGDSSDGKFTEHEAVKLLIDAHREDADLDSLAQEYGVSNEVLVTEAWLASCAQDVDGGSPLDALKRQIAGRGK